MLFIKDIRKLRNEIKNLYSAVVILKDAVSNNLGMTEYNNITDMINEQILKINDIKNAYNQISDDIYESENFSEILLIMENIKSLLNILKYSLMAKKTKVTFEDIYNCLNIILKQINFALNYSIKIVKENLPDKNPYKLVD